MANWFVKRASGEQGPFTSTQLKQFAADRQIGPDDLVRREDKEKFSRAQDVKGLFDAPPASNSAPATLVITRRPKVTGFLHSVNVKVDGSFHGSIGGGFLSGVLDLLASRDNSVTISLPDGTHEIEVAGGGLKATAKVEAVSGKVYGLKVYFSNLGILGGGLRLEEKTGAPPIAASSESKKHGAIGSGKATVRNVQENPSMTRLAATHEPVATSPRLTLRPKNVALMLGIGMAGFFVLCCGGTGIIYSIGSAQKDKVSAQLAEADGLWDSGKRVEATVRYTAMLNSPVQLAYLADQRPRVFGRGIDVELENGNEAEGRRWIETAFKMDIAPWISTDKASELIVDILSAQEAQRQAEPEPNRPQEKPESSSFGLRSSAGRKLTTQIGNSDSTRRSFRTDAYARCLRNMRCTATAGELVIEFDLDVDRWGRVEPGSPVDQLDAFPFLVRLFDRNGQYLTHFETSERFTPLEKAFEYRQQLRNESSRRPQPVLLRQKGNRFVYQVNTRDLEHAENVEFGFLEVF